MSSMRKTEVHRDVSDHFYGVVEAGSGRAGHVAWAAYGIPDSPLTPIVLVHGLSDSGGCWPGVVEHLSDSRLVVVLDLRGHGNSGLPDEPFSVDTLTDDIESVVRAVLGRPAALLGHSIGALAALNFALRYPDFTRALILEDPALGIGRGPGGGQGLRDLVQNMLTEARSRSYVSLISSARRANPDWHSDEFAPWAQAQKQFNPNVGDLVEVAADDDWTQELAGVAVEEAFPVLIAAGDPNRGSAVDAADGDSAARLLDARGRVTRLDAGHCVRRDRRTEFLSLVDETLAAAL